MDLIEISYHDYLANQVDGIYFGEWFTEDWEKHTLSNYKFPFERTKQRVPISNLSFTVGNDHVELYDGFFEKEPESDIVPDLGGRLTTLVMKAAFKIQEAELHGKMCIRNSSKPPVYTDYKLILNKADLNQIVGLAIQGDGLGFDHCKYTIPFYSLSFMYTDNSKAVSMFERVADETKRKLLKQYVLEYMIKDLCESIEDYQMTQLSIKLLVSDLTGADYSLRNLLRTHNRKLHTAFNLLSQKIISLANSSIGKKLPELKFNKIFGLVKKENVDKTLKVYTGSMHNINSMEMTKNNVIVSNDDDLVILHVPVILTDLTFRFKEVSDKEVEMEEGACKYEQKYVTNRAYFILSLKKLTKNKAEIKLLDLKLMKIEPLSESEIDLSLDYLTVSELEKQIKPYLEAALTADELQAMTINPDVEVEYDSEDFETEDSENEL